MMPLNAPEIANNAAEPLKIWNCITCRRRKVRCDRRHPCSPCTKNNVECVFPISGRVPRRSRDVDEAQVQKQAELVRRLRRLESMVGGLSSKVESATVIRQGCQSVEDSGVTTSGTSKNSSSLSSDITADATQSPHMSVDLEELQVDGNGDFIVGKGFWTIFCKEVILISPV